MIVRSSDAAIPPCFGVRQVPRNFGRTRHVCFLDTAFRPFQLDVDLLCGPKRTRQGLALGTAMLEPRPACVVSNELLLWRFGSRGVRPARGIFARDSQIARGTAKRDIPAACEEKTGWRDHQRPGPGLHPPAAARRWCLTLFLHPAMRDPHPPTPHIATPTIRPATGFRPVRGECPACRSRHQR